MYIQTSHCCDAAFVLRVAIRYSSTNVSLLCTMVYDMRHICPSTVLAIRSGKMVIAADLHDQVASQ